MTTGEQLDLNSTVSNVSALTHLTNPSGEGGGITIITEVDSLKEEDSIILAEVSTTSSLREEITEQIVEVKDTESIQQITGESLDGIC